MSRIVDGAGSAVPADGIHHVEQGVIREAEIVLLCIQNSRNDMMQYRYRYRSELNMHRK
jgi:hypothetical protein